MAFDGRKQLCAGAVGLHLIGGLPLRRPEEQVFTAMLDGWRNQQLARNLAFSTIEGREKAVRAFTRHSDAFPWTWAPQKVDEWLVPGLQLDEPPNVITIGSARPAGGRHWIADFSAPVGIVRPEPNKAPPRDG